MAKKSFSVGMASSTKIKDENIVKDMKAKQNFNFQYISRDKIVPNPLNKRYPQTDIEKLLESLRKIGLIHNICVTPDKEEGKYRLISGERRWRAISQLEDKEYKELYPSGIPAQIKIFESPIDEEIAIIAANAEDRDETQEDRRNSILRLKELYEIKRSNGDISYTNISKLIAEKIKISQRQVIKYTNTEKLIPELIELFNRETISIDEASSFAALSQDSQRKIYSIITQDGKIDSDHVQIIKRQEEEAKQLQKELAEREKELVQKENLIANLTQQLEKFNNSLSDNNSSDAFTELKEAKEKAEKERSSLKTKIKKMNKEKEEYENQKATISDSEVKKLAEIAKLEQTIMQFEKSFKILKSNKSLIENDSSIREKISLLADGLKSLLD